MDKTAVQPVKLKERILIPLAVALFLLSLVFIYSFTSHNRHDVDEHIAETRDTVTRLFQDELANDAGYMLAVIRALEQDETLRDALRRSDRWALLRRSGPLYAHLHAEHKITHFYFTNAQRVNLLRVHQPGRFGDRIDRFTTLEAERTERPTWGIELGPLGTFTLRVVAPWFEGGKHIGYVELGEEIEHIIQKLHSVNRTELVVLINKTFLKREGWSDGMRMLARTGSWDLLPAQVVTYCTFKEHGNELLNILSDQKTAADGAEYTIEDRLYRRLMLPLKDAAGRDVGALQILLDITAKNKQTWQAAWTSIGVALLVGIVLFGLFFRITRRAERDLEHSQRELVDAAERREHMQHTHLQELQHHALHDTLTGLPNRALLLDHLKQAINAYQRHSSPFLLITLDIDRLRIINDTLGHRVGDWVLQQVGQRIRASLRETDTLARVGADEFGIILLDTGTEYAAVISRKLHTIFETVFTVDGVDLNIDANIGIVAYPEHGEEPEVLVRRADIAVNHSKQNKTEYSVYDQSKDPYSRRRLALAAELRQAIKQNKLVLHYQPKINLRTGAIADVEALVRWPHPTEGLIPPNDFIPLAEQTGLINPLTQWVLDEAIQQCRTWKDAGLNVRVAVNLSAINLQNPKLPEEVGESLRVNDIDPKQLILEITESTIMADPALAIDVLTRLKSMGIALSVDDFGTGYSSLAYLSRLPVSELKIDRSFVTGMMHNENDATIVRSTIDLAHDLGLSVIAEGIETEDAWNRLAKMGCDMAQGYYMSRPLPAADLARWAKESWNIPKRKLS